MLFFIGRLYTYTLARTINNNEKIIFSQKTVQDVAPPTQAANMSQQRMWFLSVARPIKQALQSLEAYQYEASLCV